MTTATGIVNIIVKATDQTGSVFGNAFGKMQNLAGGVATAGIAAVGAASAAIAGVGVAAFNEFVAFEDQMNEVFTLLPGISQTAMGQMSDQVLAFAGDMGVLPEEVVPALYQALSAGVPANNVFDFLETAQQAALGGVTDLTTAVDGVSSVVNAYGSDVIGATEASDLMFTAVQLGKTNFEELSSSLSNVTPLASAMGVGFDQVTAALATMTSQGTSTSVATTQMRSLLQELGTAGTEVSGIFEDVAGTSFLDFVAEGGNVADALSLLEQHALDTGTPMQDMFGSIEAGVAALQLSGGAAETFQSNLDAMAGSAGATEGAFDTMNTGMARVLEQFQAKWSATLIRVGDAIAPVAEMLFNALMPALDALMPIVESIAGNFTDFFSALADGEDPLAAIETLFQDVLASLGLNDEKFNELSASISGVFDYITETAIPAITTLWDTLTEFLAPIGEAIAGFVSWKDVLIALGFVLAGVIVVAIASVIAAIYPVILVIGAVIAIVALVRNAWENNWGGIQEKTAVVLAFIQNLISTVMTAVQTFWAQNGEQIKATASAIWSGIQMAIQTYINLIQTVVTTVLTAIQTFWAEHGATILAKANEIWTAIQTAIATVLAVVDSIFQAFKSAFEGDWTSFGSNLRTAWDTAWTAIVTTITTIGETILTTVSTLITNLVAKFNETDWAAIGTAIVTGIGTGITNMTTWIEEQARAVASAALDAAKGFLGINSPSKEFAEVGKFIGQGLGQGIAGETANVAKEMTSMLDTISPDAIGLSGQFEQSVPSAAQGFLGGLDNSRNTENHFHLHVDSNGDSDDIVSSFNDLRSLVVD